MVNFLRLKVVRAAGFSMILRTYGMGKFSVLESLFSSIGHHLPVKVPLICMS